MKTETTRPQMKITYATMSADQMSDLHRELDAAIERVKKDFGRSYPMFIGGKEVRAAAEFEDRSPIDTRIVIAKLQKGTREHAKQAIAAARAAAPAWASRPWQERVALVRRVNDLIRENRWDLSALMGYEAGKNRLECVGDVEESADLAGTTATSSSSTTASRRRWGRSAPARRTTA